VLPKGGRGECPTGARAERAVELLLLRKLFLVITLRLFPLGMAILQDSSLRNAITAYLSSLKNVSLCTRVV
jgi:hypothetical protein